MPLGALLETAIQTVGGLVLEVVCYQTGRVLVPAFTFGRVQVESWPLEIELSRRKWLRKLDDGRWLMCAELTTLIGVLFWISVAAVGGLIWWLA